MLFSSRKLKKNFPNRRFTRVRRPIEEEGGRFNDARILINNRIGLEPDIGLGPAFLSSEHGRDSLDRVTSLDHEIYSRGDTRENENKIDYDQCKVLRTRDGDSWVKRNSTDNDARSFVNDLAEKVHYNGHSPRQSSWSEYFEDSLGGRRMVDEGPLLAGDLVKDEFPVVAREHTRNSFSEVGASNKDRYWVNEYNIDNCSGLISTEHYDNRKTVLADDDNLLIDSFSVKNECDMDNGCTIFADEQHGEHPRKRATGGRSYFMNDGYSCGPVMSTEHIGISPDRGIRAIDDGRFPVVENEDREHNILAEHHPAMARRATDVGIYPIRERLKHEHNADDNFGLASSTNYSGYDLVEDRRVGDESRFRKSNREENGRDMRSFRGPVNISALCLSKQSASTHTGKPSLQDKFSSPLGRDWNSSVFSCPEDRHVSHISDLTSQDAIATKAVPYDPEGPDIFRGHSSSIVVGLGSSPVQDHPFYQGSKRSPCSSLMRESSPYQIRGSRRYFDGPGYGSTTSLSNHHEVSYGTINTSSIDGYSENGEYKTPTQEGFSGSFFSDPSAPFPPSKVETTKNDSKGPLSNSFFSNMKRGFHTGSQGKYGNTAGEGTTAEELPSSDGWIRLPNGASSSEARPIDLDYEFCRGRENKRVSVFARLTSASEDRMHDSENDIDAVGDAYDTDASVDKVMAMLHHGLRHQVKNMRKDNVNVKQQDDNGIANSKRTIAPTSEQGYEQSKLKMEVDLDQTIEETGGSIFEETRHVDFRRRSKAKKNLEGTCKESSAGIAACKRHAENAETECLAGKVSVENVKVEGSTVSLCKRRKLVRPVFSKKESDEGISCDITENLKSRSRENSLKVKTGKQQEAIEGSEYTNQVAFPACYNANTAEAEKSSEKGKENAENCQSPSRCPEDEYGKQVEHNPIVISQDPSKDSSKCCGWIEW